MSPLSSMPSPRPEPFDPVKNPYKAQRQWPPDFSQMTAKQQFRLEKRYRRRAKLAYTRPGWIKGTKIAQWTAISFVTVYAVVFMDWPGKKESPFEGLRNWMQKKQDAIWTRPASPNLGRIAEQRKNQP